MFENLEEKQLNSTQVYDGVLLKVFRDDIELPNGKKSKREYIKHNGASCVVPLTDNNEIILVKQYRYPFHCVITEVPAGKRDGDEDPMLAAKRELKEETGAEAEEIIPLGYVAPSVAYTDEKIWIYLARGLSFGDSKLDDGEFLNVVKMPLEDAVKAVMENEFSDSKTVAAILKAYYYLQNEKK